MESAALARHVKRVCKQHGIRIFYVRYIMRGRAFRKERIIEIPRVESPMSYAIAMHEIGHILGKNPARRLDKEVEAWKWARRNAIHWCDRMTDEMQRCLGTYLWWAERHKGITLPSQEHPIWSMASRAHT